MNFPPLNTWQRKLHEPDPKSATHRCSRPPCIEVVTLLPIAYRVSNYINEEKRHDRDPIFDLSGIALEPPKPGPHGGVPLGGLGSGSICRGFKGEFRRWSLRPGRYIHRVIPSDMFCIRVKRGDEVYSKVLAVTQPSEHSGDNVMNSTLNSWDWSLSSSGYSGGTFYGLHPRSWTIYENPVPDTTVIVKQVSPFIPHSYSEASLPCAVFVIEVINTHETVGIETSVMFCFENGYRDEQEMQRLHVNNHFRMGIPNKKSAQHHHPEERSNGINDDNTNIDVTITAAASVDVSIEGVCMAQLQATQGRNRFNSYSIASTCSSLDQLSTSCFSKTLDNYRTEESSSTTYTNVHADVDDTTGTTTTETQTSSDHGDDNDNDNDIKSRNAMSPSLSYCESFITSYRTTDRKGTHLIDRFNSFLFGPSILTSDNDHDHDHIHGRYSYAARKLWESFKLHGTISNIDDNIIEDPLNYVGGNDDDHDDHEGESDNSKGVDEDDSLNHHSYSSFKPFRDINDKSSTTIGSAVCLKKWISPLSNTTTFHKSHINPSDKISRNDVSMTNNAVFPFALSWDSPYVSFGPSTDFASNQQNLASNSTSSDTDDRDGRLNEVPRYYTRFFGCSGLSSPKIASWALMKYCDWDKQIDKWQASMNINPLSSVSKGECDITIERKNNNDNNRLDRNENRVDARGSSNTSQHKRDNDDNHIQSGRMIPGSNSFYNSQLFNELYYLVDGGSIWTDTKRGSQ